MAVLTRALGGQEEREEGASEDRILNIPNGSHFCCLALHGPRLRIKQEHIVLPGLIVSHEQKAFELEPHWVEWLGTIQANSFRESTIFITAIVDPLIVDAGTVPVPQSLDNSVRLFHHVLVMLGCGYNDAMLMVGGEKYHSGGINIGPVRPGLTPCFRPYYRQSRKIEVEDLECAAKILENLELIYRHVPGRLYRRLRKGFNVWVRGAQEGEELIERLHSFVRATEAILKPTIARKRGARARKLSKTAREPWRNVTPTFISRGQTITGASQKNAKLLRQLYDIRSSVEHVKDVMPSVKRVRDVDAEEGFGFRALQAEILASTAYSRILGSDKLLNAFSTELKVEGFWSRRADQRQPSWGIPIDLDAEARRWFFSQIVPDFY